MGKGICCWTILFGNYGDDDRWRLDSLRNRERSSGSRSIGWFVSGCGHDDSQRFLFGTVWVHTSQLRSMKGRLWIEDTVISILTCGSSSAVFHVSGLSSDPGKSWLISMDCNDISRFGAESSYFYDDSTGRARRGWVDLLGLKSGSRVSCKTTHS